MEILGYLLGARTPFNLMLALIGVVLGTIVGALPGLSLTMAVAVLVPFTFTMDPAAGLIALGAIYTGAICGGAYAAILVNTPGTPSAIATTFDGFPMARRGDGGLTISLATIASVGGGIVGAISLLLLAPPLARVALAFGPTEYFWLAMFGLTLIAALSIGNTLTEARRASKTPENFGKGDPDGVIATESANNATVGGGFIPTLVLGIPGTPPDVIILGALLVQGIKIGPSLFSAQASVVYTFIWGLLIATVLMLPAGLLIGRYVYSSVIKVPKAVLAPTAALLTVIGAFAIHSNVDDAQMMVGLGLIAWLLSRYGFAPSPIVLGLVLGQIAEQGFVQTYLIGNASDRLTEMFFGRPISIGIIIAALVTLLYPILSERRAKRLAAKVAAEAPIGEDGLPDAPERGRDTPAIILATGFTVLGILIFWGARDLSPLGSVFPSTNALAMIIFSLALIALNLSGRSAPSMHMQESEGSAKHRLALAAVMVLWVMLVPVVGFFVTSLVAYAAVMFIADYDRPGLRTWIIGIATATGLVAGFWWIMSNVLLLRMPSGILF